MKKNIILFDDDHWNKLLPLTYTRPICEIRIGTLTIKEKWEKHLNANASYITQDFLSAKYPINIAADNWLINATALPTLKLVKLISQLSPNEAILAGDELIAARLDAEQFDKLVEEEDGASLNGIDIEDDTDTLQRVTRPYHIFDKNKAEIAADFELLTKGRKSEALSHSNTVLGSTDQVFIEPGGKVECSILNTTEGPIYIGKDAEIMEGSMIRGPFSMGNNAVVKMGAKVYGATTIGPHCKIGGEVNNSVLFGYSNKGHEGYLGNSVLGEWCNLGADTNNSNLKNNYTEVKIWDYTEERFMPTGLQFCGLIMGDHSKTGINTMFNTGTVVGVNANIFGSGYPRNFIPSYSWGGNHGFTTYTLTKALDTARRMMKRRGLELTEEDQVIFEHIFYSSSALRVWEESK